MYDRPHFSEYGDLGTLEVVVVVEEEEEEFEEAGASCRHLIEEEEENNFEVAMATCKADITAMEIRLGQK